MCRSFIISSCIGLLAIISTVPIGFAKTPSYIIKAGNQSDSLLQKIDILEDKNSEYQIGDMLKPEISSQFYRNSKPKIAFGFTTSTYWFRFKIKYESIESYKSLMVIISRIYIKEIDLYSTATNGEFYVKKSGLNRINNLETYSKFYAFSVKTDSCYKDALGEMTFFIRVKSDAVSLPISIQTLEEYSSEQSKAYIVNGLYYGILISMLLYNLIIYLSLKDRSYLYYVLYVISFSIAFAVVSQTFFDLLPPSFIPIIFQYDQIPIFTTIILAILFSRSFLNINLLSPSLYKFCQNAIYTDAFLSLALPLFPIQIASQLQSLIIVINLLLLIYLGVFAAYKKYHPARYYLVAWAMLVISTLIAALAGLGLAIPGWNQIGAIQFGSAAEMILFSLALADRISTMQSAKEKADKAALEAEIYRLKTEELAKALHEAEVQRKIADEASQLKTELLALAAHDLQNPLSAIMAFADMNISENQTGGSSQKSKTNIQLIRDLSFRMLHIIKELLNITAIEDGQINLKRRVIDIGELVKVLTSRYEALAAKKNQTFEISTEPDCNSFVDEDRVAEIIENLVSNAIKYSDFEKKVNVFVEKHKDHIENTEWIKIKVKDEGQGLSDDDKQKLFRKFQRLSSTPTSGESSTGLGLSIVKHLTELHGGKVWAESEGKKKGSEFIVLLPAA